MSSQAFRFFTPVSCTPVDFCNLILPSDSDPKPSVEQSTPPFFILLCNFLKTRSIWLILTLNLMVMCVGVLQDLIFGIYADISLSKALSCLCSWRTEMISLHYFLTRKDTSMGNCSSGWSKCLEWQDIKSSVYISYQLLPWLQSLSTWCLCFCTCITMLGFRFPPVN